MLNILISINYLINDFFQKLTKNSLNHEDKKVEVKERDFPDELPGSEYKMELVWRNIIIFIFLHAGATYGFMVTKNSWATVIFSEYLFIFFEKFQETQFERFIIDYKEISNQNLNVLSFYS